MKVVRSGEAFQVKSEKSETGTLAKRAMVLKELGGKYADEYAATLLGNAAMCVFREDDLVAATLRFATHEHNGLAYQDIVVTEIHSLTPKHV